MSSKRIEEMKLKRAQAFAAKKSQVKYGWIVAAIALAIFLIIFNESLSDAFTWIVGLMIGYTIQRSKFCFTAGFRDPVLVGSTSVMRGIVVSFIVMTLLFGVFIYKNGTSILVEQINPAGLNTALGAIIFGIGMVVAGGCASGTLMRIGEGFKLQWTVLIGFIIGSLLSAGSFEFWDKLFIKDAVIVNIADKMDIRVAVFIQMIVLIGLYYALKRYDKKNSMLVD